MKKILLGMGALALLLTSGCVTESEDALAPYYYPNTNPPFAQGGSSASHAAVDAYTAPMRVASTSTSPAN